MVSSAVESVKLIYESGGEEIDNLPDFAQWIYGIVQPHFPNVAVLRFPLEFMRDNWETEIPSSDGSAITVNGNSQIRVYADKEPEFMRI